ncbi:MAG TPA: phosphatase PAP2 family protein [Candidatus Saccharimonadales bacterium]|jgi:undecaprenyl-diphosphatase
MNQIRTFDVAITKLIGKLPKRLHSAFDVLGYMTIPTVWAFLLLIFIVRWADEPRVLTEGIIVLLLVPVATITKLFIRRHRPMTIYADAMNVKSYSFPSSHAYTAALVGGYFASVAFQSGLTALSMAFVALVGLIGVSRVHLGAHYPSDVIVGWLLGICFLAMVLSR